jgi:hypothetical protein
VSDKAVQAASRPSFEYGLSWCDPYSTRGLGVALNSMVMGGAMSSAACGHDVLRMLVLAVVQ